MGIGPLWESAECSLSELVAVALAVDMWVLRGTASLMLQNVVTKAT